MSVQPLRDFVVVSKEDAPETTPGGLFVPKTASENKIASGEVLAIGSGRVGFDGKVVALEVKVGDRVSFNRNLATELSDGGKVVYLLREDQLLCIHK